MPKYTYRCEGGCGKERDIEHPMSESRQGERCDYKMDCYGTLRKVFTPTPAVFKGRGWYSKGG